MLVRRLTVQANESSIDAVVRNEQPSDAFVFVDVIEGAFAPMTTQIALPHLEKTVVMLDFDGTLVDLAPTPSSIVIPEDLSRLLSKLQQKAAGLTLISGRAINDFTVLFPEYTGSIIGSHGGELRHDGQYEQIAKADKNALGKVWNTADALAAQHANSLIVERKPAGVVIHYRKSPELEDKVVQTTQAIVAKYQEFEVHDSKMASEIRVVGPTKGQAARRILQAAKAGTTSLFAGDDLTDEDAITVVNSAGGVTVKIGDGPTAAQHRIASPKAFRALLAHWAKGN